MLKILKNDINRVYKKILLFLIIKQKNSREFPFNVLERFRKLQQELDSGINKIDERLRQVKLRNRDDIKIGDKDKENQDISQKNDDRRISFVIQERVGKKNIEKMIGLQGKVTIDD